MFQTNVRILLSVIYAIAISGCSNDPDNPQFAAANGSGKCEFQVTGTSQPPSSGSPTVISDITGTVISANFFNSGAIDPPHFDGNESVSICVTAPDINGNRTAEITTDVGLDNDFNIKAYPQFVVGTKFGNIFETSYRYYPNTGLPAEHQWPVISSNLSNQNTPFEFANLEYVSAVKGVGLPAFTNNLPNISITLDIDEANVVGAERDVMLESWFYDTSANASIIGNNVATGLPIANTLNNIVGVGHPHYDELDNTLLEMMVHLGALSPHDVSEANNNPGQNQLTEVFSGKDFDLDGIDDHFDVDSHAFLNSSNPADPQPGLYSSGIDNNGDGIDDADLLPVQMGEHLYSIWYGQSFLSPIVIYSRETNTSLQNDFDPNTPDMDLTTEGEITLPWNEFLDFTITDIQPLLQTADVTWATEIDNIFQKMSSSGGAISGVEFGVEPQTNNPADQPYDLTVNKFEIDINGTPLGLIPSDVIRPTSDIQTPENAAVFGSNSPTITLSGTAEDNVEVERVMLSIKNLDLAQNWNGSSFQSGEVRVLATGTDNWSYDFAPNLPGNYRLATFAIDSSGNIQNTYNGVRFRIQGADSVVPTSNITNPLQNDILSATVTMSGTAIDNVEVAQVMLSIKNLDLAQNWNGTSFQPGEYRVQAIGTDTWSYDFSPNLPGNYRLATFAIDSSGNVQNTYNGVKFQIQGADSTVPNSTITSPLQGDTPSSTVTMSGTADDNVEVERVMLSIKNLDLAQNWNGSSFQSGEVRVLATGTDNWSYDFAPNLPGNYRLATFAIDSSRNIQNTYNGVRFRIQGADSVAPTSNITNPLQNDILSATVTMSGNSDDNVEVAQVMLSIKNLDLAQNWNGTSFQPGEFRVLATGTDDWSYDFSPNLPGNYRLATFAIDSSGNTQNTYNGVKFQIQDPDPTGASNTAIDTNTVWNFTQTSDGSTVDARHEAGAVVVNGKIYVMGGRGNRTVQSYDPATNNWMDHENPPVDFHHYQPVAIGNMIYVVTAFVGNFPSETPLGYVYRFNTTKDTWTQLRSIPANKLLLTKLLM